MSQSNTAPPKAPTSRKPKFSVAITTEGYQKLINNTLGDPERAKRFIAGITSAVSVNPQLQECDAGTILAGALLGECIGLSPSPQLGQYYLVPFEIKVKDENGSVIYMLDEKGNKLKDEKGRWMAVTEKRAQFVLGYKGYVQLALRSGCYADLDVMEIKESEYKGKDKNTGKPRFEFIEDDDVRDELPTIGYMAYFEYLNGFRKVVYWSSKKMLKHADTYSSAFSADAYEKLQKGEIPQEELWKYSSFWYKDFGDMAKKTLLRHLISRWGIMSTEMQRAYSNDQSMMGFSDSNELVPITTLQPDSPDNPEAPEPPGPSAPPRQNSSIIKPEADRAVEKVDLSAL